MHSYWNKNGHYSIDTIKNIQIVYIIAAILWIIVFFWVKAYFSDTISWLFIFIPLVVFSINYLSLTKINVETENQMFRGNYLSFGLLIVIILINWNNPMGPQDKIMFFRVLLVAFVLIMLSLIDVWVYPCYLSIVKHIRSILQTSALTLLALSLYLYYVETQIYNECI